MHNTDDLKDCNGSVDFSSSAHFIYVFWGLSLSLLYRVIQNPKATMLRNINNRDNIL